MRIKIEIDLETGEAYITEKQARKLEPLEPLLRVDLTQDIKAIGEDLFDTAVVAFREHLVSTQTIAREQAEERLLKETAMQGLREEFIMDHATNDIGWKKKDLASWGVAWPPAKGWKKNLIANGSPQFDAIMMNGGQS